MKRYFTLFTAALLLTVIMTPAFGQGQEDATTAAAARASAEAEKDEAQTRYDNVEATYQALNWDIVGYLDVDKEADFWDHDWDYYIAKEDYDDALILYDADIITGDDEVFLEEYAAAVASYNAAELTATGSLQPLSLDMDSAKGAMIVLLNTYAAPQELATQEEKEEADNQYQNCSFQLDIASESIVQIEDYYNEYLPRYNAIKGQLTAEEQQRCENWFDLVEADHINPPAGEADYWDIWLALWDMVDSEYTDDFSPYWWGVQYETKDMSYDGTGYPGNYAEKALPKYEEAVDGLEFLSTNTIGFWNVELFGIVNAFDQNELGPAPDFEIIKCPKELIEEAEMAMPPMP